MPWPFATLPSFRLLHSPQQRRHRRNLKRLRRLFLEPLETRNLLTNTVGFILYGFPPSEIDEMGNIPITRYSDDFDDDLTINYTVSGSATKGATLGTGVDHNLMSGSR